MLKGTIFKEFERFYEKYFEFFRTNSNYDKENKRTILFPVLPFLHISRNNVNSRF